MASATDGWSLRLPPGAPTEKAIMRQCSVGSMPW